MFVVKTCSDNNINNDIYCIEKMFPWSKYIKTVESNKEGMITIYNWQL